MLEALNSDQYERFVSSFAGMLRRDRRHDLEGDGYGEGIANVPITAIAPNLVSRRHRKWRKAGK